MYVHFRTYNFVPERSKVVNKPKNPNVEKKKLIKHLKLKIFLQNNDMQMIFVINKLIYFYLTKSYHNI